MKSSTLILLVAFAILSCKDNTKTNSADKYKLKWPDSLLAKKIRDTLRTFPFIKERDRFYDSLTNHKEGVTFTMDTSKGKIYPTAVFYIEEEKRFQKLYRFEVNPETLEIKVNDINTGTFITIEEYYKLAPEEKK